MGISIRAYARARGVSDAAVRKAIKSGRITPESDGTIEPARADREWRRNTAQQQAKQRAVPNEAIAAVHEAVGAAGLSGGSPGGGTTFLQARTANEVLKAQTNKVRLARLKGELVDRAQAIGHVFTLARAERDAWLNWPSRISAQMAARLGIDAHPLHVALEAAVREQLQELGETRVRVD